MKTRKEIKAKYNQFNRQMEVDFDLFIKGGRGVMFTDAQIDFLWSWFEYFHNKMLDEIYKPED